MANHSALVPIQNAICDFKTRKKVSFQIATEFGIVDITRKEAIRMLETCEKQFAYLTECCQQSTIILEYPYDENT